MQAGQFLRHLHDYAAHFGCLEHVRLGTTVEGCARDSDNGWIVSTSRGVIRSRYLVIATGVNHCPYVPPALQMQVEAAGVPWFHAHDYVTHGLRERLSGQRVLLIGGSDNAADIAGDLVHRSADNRIVPVTDLHVSIRNGQWFQERMFGADSPADMY